MGDCKRSAELLPVPTRLAISPPAEAASGPHSERAANIAFAQRVSDVASATAPDRGESATGSRKRSWLVQIGSGGLTSRAVVRLRRAHPGHYPPCEASKNSLTAFDPCRSFPLCDRLIGLARGGRD
jgi:hypothetical protein